MAPATKLADSCIPADYDVNKLSTDSTVATEVNKKSTDSTVATEGDVYSDLEEGLRDSTIVGLTRTGSYMQDVWLRIEGEASKNGLPHEPSAVAVTHTISSQMSRETQVPKVSVLRMPFWLVMAFLTICLLLMQVSAGYLLRLPLRKKVRAEAVGQFNSAVQAQRGQIEAMLRNTIDLEYGRVLRKVHEQVLQYVVELPDRAVDGMWNLMQVRQKFGNPLQGNTQRSRQEIAYAAWGEVASTNPLRLELINRADAVWVYFANGAFSGVYGSRIREMGTRQGVDSMWLEQGPDSNHSLLNLWHIDQQNGDPIGSPEQSRMLIAKGSSFYDVQTNIAKEYPNGLAVQAWSGIHDLSGGPAMLSWTAPIAYCGNYSCLEGVVAASITVHSVNYWCRNAWMDLRRMLAGPPYNFQISENNSAVFVVSQDSRSQDQEGMIIGWFQGQSSDATMLNLHKAVNSRHGIVRRTSKAILDKFGSWNTMALRHEQPPFAVHVNDGRGLDADDCKIADESDNDCLHVATLSVRLDSETHWLVVMALPVHGFSGAVRVTKKQVDEEVKEAETGMVGIFNQLSVIELSAIAGMTLASIVLGVGLSRLLSHDLRQLQKMMQHLCTLSFSDEGEFAELQAGKRAFISDVSDLQDAFCRLTNSVRTFARFVPATVVKNIVRGNARALRLHVSRREVTVMFSDIHDFTSISESLSPHDLLLILTRYLSVMTKVVEMYDGVVTEILGDGVLAFWNTPDDVPDHAAKACASALGQQAALVSLNAELEGLRMPRLAIRIGLHTGVVLSGNLGSETRMKFGCLGDAVNLASRLEGLCKNYGAGVICSGCTHGALPPDAGFICRKLDLIQVKGRTEPTDIYELMGRDLPEEVLFSEQRAHAKAYEGALRAFQQAEFDKAQDTLEALTLEFPEDVAAARLLKKVVQYHDSDPTRGVVLTEEERRAWTGITVMTEK